MEESPKPKSRHTYEYEIELDSDTAPARVLRMVQPRTRVLEIGAGPGSITKRLLGTLECDVVALEVEATAIEKLKEFCPKVYDMDLNDAGWVAALLKKEARFDYVIAADVLEHVYDPWKVLGGMRELLTPTGSVILSLPHVGHAAVLGCLVDEDMQYGPWGLLDRTHVRFFGIKNVQSLYRSQGMAIEEAQFVVRTPEMTEFVARWKRLPEDVRAALQRNRFSHVYQVVTRAVPAARATRNLDLMEQPVEPAGAEAERYWTEAMAGLQSDPALDRRSTIPGYDAAEAAMPTENDLDALRQKITARGEDVRLIAFYLTQFHPIPENDLWWGKGFTEWTNVTKAKPRFRGHYQPHLPADLGYYDLRVPEVMREQIAMARAHGIDGFCYYYYWFSGHRLLERPLDAMLADPEADMPFCLCWANENWTRAWDAGNKEILIAQEYRPNDNLDFIRSLEPYLRDPRYIRVNGAPLLLVYRPQHLPDAQAAVQVWREHCRAVGIGEIHVASALTHGNWDYRQFGFDAGVEFPPHNMRGPDFSPHVAFSTPWQGYMPDYSDIAEMYLKRPHADGERVYRGIFPSWDNTARRGDHGVVILNGTPENYERWLAESIRLAREERPAGERLVFVNAWNEWAEGCHLEPCRKFGHRFLEATLRAKAGSSLGGWTHVGLPPGIGLAGTGAEDSGGSAPGGYRAARKPRGQKPKQKSALSRSFRALRDTLNGRRFKK